MTQTIDQAVIDLETAEKDPTPSRRAFLRTGIFVVAGGISLTVAVPTLGYFAAPAAGKEGSEVLVSVGKVADLANQTDLKTVTLRNVTYTDTFKKATLTRKVFVRALKPDASQAEDFLVLDSTCTHAGCSVDYNTGSKEIFCGCHGSYYDQSGNNLKGPAPRPLGTYEVKIQNGEIMINAFQTFGTH